MTELFDGPRAGKILKAFDHCLKEMIGEVDSIVEEFAWLVLQNPENFDMFSINPFT